MRSHGAVASVELGRARVEAILEDWRAAGLEPRMAAAFEFLERLTPSPDEIGPEDIAALRAAGLSTADIEDVVEVCTLFCTINAIADALDFHVGDPEVFHRTAGVIYRRGYR